MHTDLVRQPPRATRSTLFQRAIDRGELQPDIDLEFAADTLGAPLFYRHLVMHDAVSDDVHRHVVDGFLDALRHQR